MTKAGHVRRSGADEGARRDALVERMFETMVGAMELLSVRLGITLGLYEALDAAGPGDAAASPADDAAGPGAAAAGAAGAGAAAGGGLTPAELAARAGVTARYAREWLEQQASAGFVLVEDEAAPPDERRFRLPTGHAEALLDADSPAYVGAAPAVVEGLARGLGLVSEAVRQGTGVPFARFGAVIRDGIAGLNRRFFVNELASHWLVALPDVHGRLVSEPPARVLDVGCGTGWSTVALARAYPTARFVAVDLDEASVGEARRNAAEAGVADRVEHHCADAFDLARDDRRGGFDLVTAFEAVHDMERPLEVLTALRTVLRPGASLVLADTRVADRFAADAGIVDRLAYAWSVLHCLPVGQHGGGPAEGAVLRPDRVRELAAAAGFATVEQLAITSDLWSLYCLRSGPPGSA